MAPRGPGLVLIGGGIAAVGVLLFAAATPGGREVVRRIEAVAEGWARNVIARVSAHEGKPDSLNRNLDGAGLAFGIIQWTQKSGNLGVVLEAMRDADPRAFERIFGASWSTMLGVARRGSLEPVDGAPLWDEPWVSRFVEAGRWPAFVEVQWSLAAQGEHFRGAEDVARILGVRTERSMTLFFDRSVQQGPVSARSMAETLRSRWSAAGRTSIPYLDALQAYSDLAASKFRRTSTPSTPYYSERSRHILWKPVGAEWHAFAGQWDLYATIVRRTSGILSDRHLSDAPIGPGVA
jgi:hypothetical protein